MSQNKCLCFDMRGCTVEELERAYLYMSLQVTNADSIHYYTFDRALELMHKWEYMILEPTRVMNFCNGGFITTAEWEIEMVKV